MRLERQVGTHGKPERISWQAFSWWWDWSFKPGALSLSHTPSRSRANSLRALFWPQFYFLPIPCYKVKCLKQIPHSSCYSPNDKPPKILHLTPKFSIASNFLLRVCLQPIFPSCFSSLIISSLTQPPDLFSIQARLFATLQTLQFLLHLSKEPFKVRWLKSCLDLTPPSEVVPPSEISGTSFVTES